MQHWLVCVLNRYSAVQCVYKMAVSVISVMAISVQHLMVSDYK